MRRLTCVVLLALVAPAAAQTSKDQGIKDTLKIISRDCGGAFMGAIDSAGEPPKAGGYLDGDPSRFGAFVRSSERILPAFKAAYPDAHVIVAVVSNGEINAWTVQRWGSDSQGRRISLVCMPTVFVEFIGNEDELAFVIGHEIGHAVDTDPGCRSYGSLAREAKVLCEIRADAIGYHLLRQANYSPYAAAGYFGRIEMYSGDTHTGITGMFTQLAIDHPITPKRIENMRRLLIEELRAAR